MVECTRLCCAVAYLSSSCVLDLPIFGAHALTFIKYGNQFGLLSPPSFFTMYVKIQPPSRVTNILYFCYMISWMTHLPPSVTMSQYAGNLPMPGGEMVYRPLAALGFFFLIYKQDGPVLTVASCRAVVLCSWVWVGG